MSKLNIWGKSLILDKLHKEFDDKEIIWCEIGVWDAPTAHYILENFNVKKIYLIDPFLPARDWIDAPSDYRSVMKRHFPDILTTRNNRDKSHNRLSKYESKCVWLEDFSYNVHNKLDDESCDIIYVDGEHTYSGVIKDLELYYPKVKKGGWIICDDYHIDGVKKAVIDFSELNNLTINESTKGENPHIGKIHKCWMVK